MPNEPIRLSYNAQLSRVRCEISRAQARESEAPPYDLVNRARAKLESIKKLGDIDFYLIYESRLGEVWTALQQGIHLPDQAKCVVTLGAGARHFDHLSVDNPISDKALGSLTAGPLSADEKQWPFDWLKLNILRKLKENNVRDQPHDAQLSVLWFKLLKGELLQGVPLNSASVLVGPTQGQARPYVLLANKQRLEVTILIRSLQDLAANEPREALFGIVEQAVSQLAQPGYQFSLLKKEAFQAIQASLEGPEGLGLEMPLTVLAAIGYRQNLTEDQSIAAEIPPLIQPNYPGAGLISFAASSDKMEAVIRGFQIAFYDDPTLKVDLDWIRNEMKYCGISAPMPEDAGKLLSEAIANRANLDGLLTCRGKSSVGGRKPYLYHVYKEAGERAPQANLEKDSLNIRDMQNRSTVKAGQLVAEVRYTSPPQPGENIYGEVVPAPPGEDPTAKAGDGVELRNGLRYYALEEGTPNFDNNIISISKTLIHRGDVNLRSGNIRFPGPVEITGSIDQGATVEAGGDLLVHGEIRGADVSARGQITVKGGVSTGAHGAVHCRGDFRADFVESSHLVIGGNIVVNKAILNSHVVCGGTIQIAANDGVIGGGHIISRDSVRTNNLGFRSGAVTILDVGVDWKVAHGIEIRQGRMERLNQKAQEDRQNLREIVQKSKSQMTSRHVQLKEELQERLTRMRSLIERLEVLVQNFKARLTFSSTAQIYVRGTLASNVRVELCGQKIPILNEVAGACLSSKRRRGSFILPLEEIEKEEAEKGTSPFGNEKKAS